MGTCTYGCLMNVINIGNSIIGVSILAMPYCFRKCGILLSMVLILISGILTRLACYLLLKSAIMARRRNFEFLAFHTFGSTGKLAVEISVVGFLIGVCIAFFVVIGDLGPPLASEFLNIENSPNLRTNVLMLVGLCVALPLGMLRKIDSLTSLSALSIAFYGCLVLKIFSEAAPNLIINEWWYEVNWWQSEGILPCLPIFSMALSCQTQLFEFFDTLNDPSLKRMQTVVNGAVHLCSAVYILVGTFGYIAFHNSAITGNVLILLSPSAMTEIIKLGFIITVAVSFPLCLFPCRSSLHSLLFKQAFGHHDITVNVIPDSRFRILTVSLVIVTIGIAIMLPNIEFVLGIIGSTIGTLICLIFPALMFIHDTSKNTSEKRLAQTLLCIGLFILIACTYTTLKENSQPHKPVLENQDKDTSKLILGALSPMSSAVPKITEFPDKMKEGTPNSVEKEIRKKIESFSKIPDVSNDQKRLEPPVPQEPESKAEQPADLDPQALQKEDKELQKDVQKTVSIADTTSKKKEDLDKQQQILIKLEEQHKEQKLILEQQKQVLQELKLHKESHEEQKKVNLAEKQDILPQQLGNDKIPESSLKNLPVQDKVITQSVEHEIPRVDNQESKPLDFKPEKMMQFNASSNRNLGNNQILNEKKQISDDVNNRLPDIKNNAEKKFETVNAEPHSEKIANESIVININVNQKLKEEKQSIPVAFNASLELVSAKPPEEDKNVRYNSQKIEESVKQQPVENVQPHIAKRDTLQNEP